MRKNLKCTIFKMNYQQLERNKNKISCLAKTQDGNVTYAWDDLRQMMLSTSGF